MLSKPCSYLAGVADRLCERASATTNRGPEAGGCFDVSGLHIVTLLISLFLLFLLAQNNLFMQDRSPGRIFRLSGLEDQILRELDLIGGRSLCLSCFYLEFYNSKLSTPLAFQCYCLTTISSGLIFSLVAGKYRSFLVWTVAKLVGNWESVGNWEWEIGQKSIIAVGAERAQLKANLPIADRPLSCAQYHFCMKMRFISSGH